MRSAALSAARLALLAGPAVLSFFSGGYFSEARTWAGLGVWLLVVVGLLAERRPLPRGRLGLARDRRARRLRGLDAAVGHVGADRRQRLRLRADRGSLHGRPARRRDPAQAARRRLARRAGDGGRSADRDRLRPVGAPAPRRPALRALDQRPGTARAAADLLERDGRAGGARLRAVRRAGRRRDAAPPAAGCCGRRGGAARGRALHRVLARSAVRVRGRPGHAVHPRAPPRATAQHRDRAGGRAGGVPGGGADARLHLDVRIVVDARARRGDRVRGDRAAGRGRRGAPAP